MKHLKPFFVVLVLLSCSKPDPSAANARLELNAFAKSIGDYRQQNGRWPVSLIEAAGQTCPSVHPSCVSGKGKRQDPWGTLYEYDQSLRSILVRSAGPDRLLGTKDDLEISVAAPAPAKP